MEIKVSTESKRVPITIIQVDGDINSSNYHALLSKAQELIKGGAGYMLIDLANTPYISSAGLRTIHTIFIDLRSIHPEENLTEEQMDKDIRAGTYKSPYLKLLNLTSNVQGVFTMGGFSRYIEAYTDLETALASF